MSLGADVLRTLPELQAAAESMMVDFCVVGTAGEPVWNEATKSYDQPVTSSLYEGKCRYRAGNTAVHEVDAQGQPLIEQSDVLHLPVVGTAGLGKDMVAVVTLTLDGSEPFTVRITGGHQQTFSTARRFPVEKVT